MKKIICLCFLLMLSGCKTEYKDISSSQKYQKILGASYEALVPFNFYGVTLDKNYAPNVDVYMITNVALGGQEKITKETLKSGSKIIVKKVLSCSKCLVPDVLFHDIWGQSKNYFLVNVQVGWGRFLL